MTDLAVADLSHIPVSQGLAATLTRASEGARATGAREVSLEHVLAALCDDSDAADVLTASHIDPARLKSETIAYLAQRDDGARGSPPAGQIAVSAPLMRILEAAAAAARGGRRRDINGAIVLAAIVGDGASMAAQLLQKHGLTFDGAIRALQAALAQPQRSEIPAMAPAEDVLARARERVQSRAAPSLRDIMLEKGHVPEKPPPAPSQPDSFQDTAEPPGTPPEPAAEGAPSPQAVGSQPQPAKSVGEIGETSEQIRSTSPAARQEASAKPPESPSASDAGAMGKPPSELPPGPVKPDPAEPRKQGSSDASPEPSPQAGWTNRQSPAGGPSTTPAGPPPWVKTAPGPGLSPPAPTLAPPPSPAPRPQVQPMGANHGSAPGQTVPAPAAAATNAIPLPPGLEVRRTGGPQPPPIPPPMPKAPPNQAGFGAQPMARATQPPSPPLGLPSGMPPAPGNLPGMPPMGRPQGAPSGVMPPPPRIPPAPANAPGPAAARAREATREPAKAELGQLTETIPRTMRVGVTERVEIRIGRAHIKNMADGMEGGGLAWQHDVTVTKAMAVRVRAPDGGFFIETVSPETQWIDRQFDDGPDYASWRFLITPQQRGWATLRIHISARTVGSEGVAAETAFPDQVIEVKVRTNYGRAAKRTLGWIAAAVAGGMLARFGEGAFDAGSGLISKLLG